MLSPPGAPPPHRRPEEAWDVLHRPSLAEMAIQSVDTLSGGGPPSAGGDGDDAAAAADSAAAEEGWNDRPPLLTGRRGAEETALLLKTMLRKGVPRALRCAVWLSNVIQITHPHEDPSHWHSYRTLAKVRALDGAYESVLQRVLELELDQQDGAPASATSRDAAAAWEALPTPTFGRSSPSSASDDDDDDALSRFLREEATPAGRLALKRVLIAVQRVLRIDAPAPAVPTLAALLLTALSESYAFCALREVLGHRSDWYLAIGKRSCQAQERAFCDVLRRLHPATASYLDDRGVLDDLSHIFRNLFVGLLPLRCVKRVVDVYTLEGSKALFRFGVSLLVLYKVESAEQLITISTANEWWDGMRQWTHNANRFDFELVVRKAYGVHGRGLRRQLRFPRRHILQRIVAIEEERIAEADDGGADGDNGEGHEDATPAQPLGLIRPASTAPSSPPLRESHPSSPGDGGGGTTKKPQLPHALPRDSLTEADCVAKPVLASSPRVRLHLASWLPLALRATNLELLYSTSYHGRSLETLYRRVRNHRHTVLLCEVLDPQPPSPPPSPEKKEDNGGANDSGVPPSWVIGAYASQVWHASPRVYGDAQCLLFRLLPDPPRCWKWSAVPPGKARRVENPSDLLDEDDDRDASANADNNRTALLEQFMVGTRTYLSVGGTSGGSAGLRLNEDLTKGESSPAAGYGNDPLGGGPAGRVFDVGLVEVYGLVRALDGRPA